MKIFISLLSMVISFQAIAQTDGETPSEASIRYTQALQDMTLASTQDQVANYETARTQAAANNQTMLVLFTATWCGYCPSFLAEVRNTLQFNPHLSERFVVHPVVLHTYDMVNEKMVVRENASGTEAAQQIFEPIADGSNITFDSVIRGFPTMLMVEPRTESVNRIVSTGPFVLPRDRWQEGQYHDWKSIQTYLINASSGLSCSALF